MVHCDLSSRTVDRGGRPRRSQEPSGGHIHWPDEGGGRRNDGEAESWKESRSEGWRKAWTAETHYGISIVQADDQWDLEHAVYWIQAGVTTSLAGDLYPGSLGVTSFGSATRPNSSSYYFWGGSEPKYGYSGVTVTGIVETGGVITAKMAFVPRTPTKK